MSPQMREHTVGLQLAVVAGEPELCKESWVHISASHKASTEQLLSCDELG